MPCMTTTSVMITVFKELAGEINHNGIATVQLLLQQTQQQ